MLLRYILSLFARPRPYKCAPPLRNAHYLGIAMSKTMQGLRR